MKCLFIFLNPFLIRIFVFLVLRFKTKEYIYILCIFCIQDLHFTFYKYVLPLCGLSFPFLHSVFCSAEAFDYNKIQLTNIFFHHAFRVVSKNSPHPRSPNFFPCYLLEVLKFRSVICFELIFVKNIRSMCGFILCI